MKHDEVQRALDQFRKTRISHAIMESTLVMVERAILWNTGRPLVCLVGPPGGGRTVLAETICARAQEGDGRFPGPCLLVTAPRDERGGCAWECLYRAVHRALESPFADEIWTGRGGTPPRFSQASKTQRDTMHRESTCELIRDGGLSAVFIDRAERLLVPTQDQDPLGSLLHLASLAEVTATPHVVLLPYAAMPLLVEDWELARCSRLIHFRPYRGNSAADMKEFVRALYEFEIRMRSLANSDLIAHAENLWKSSLGCIGLLHEILTDAASYALEAGRNKWRQDDLASAAMTKKQHARLRKEIIRGEGYFGLAPKDLQQLELDLTYLDEAPRDDAPGDQTTGETAPKRRRGPVGKPRPRRRPIGMQPAGGANGGDGDNEDEHAPESP